MKTSNILLLLLLTGCIVDDSSTPSTSNPAPIITPPSITVAAPDPLAIAQGVVAQSTMPTLGFYDVDYLNQPRTIRNDLTQGQLQGQVQFVQSHSIDPKGNAAKNMPTLVALRTALLLFTPTDAMPSSSSISVDILQNGVTIKKIALNPPYLQPRSDKGSDIGDVMYSTKAWSAELPWDLVKPGMSLEFQVGTKLGALIANDIEFSAPSELLIFNLRLGMLTDPPTTYDYPMENKPEEAASDYFQTIPTSRMILAHYLPVKLDKVIVSTGVIYTTASTDNGGYYDGDMRENTAKATVSTGINLANFGIISDTMRQWNPHIFNQRVLVHAQGVYANGVQLHGLSGGNGMALLLDSSGNELSHELGHSWGLGHYPGSTQTSLKGASHHADSGWGYLAQFKRMRGNLLWDEAFNSAGTFTLNGLTFSENFANKYNYNRDAMSGGAPKSSLSNYTHHIGSSAKVAQDHLSPIAIPDLTFPSGAKVWKNNQFVDAKIADANYNQPKALSIGVPVVTLLGGYTVDNAAKNLIYPPFFGSWGNVFNLPAPTATGNACWVRVFFINNDTQNIALDWVAGATRQFAFNISASRSPTKADLICRVGNGAENLLSTTNIVMPATQPNPAVIIGQSWDYDALRTRLLANISTLLQNTSSDAPAMDAASEASLKRFRNHVNDLPLGVQAKAQKILKRMDGLVLAQAYMINAGNNTVSLQDGTKKQELAALITNNDVLPKDAQGLPMFPNGAMLRPTLNTDTCTSLITDQNGVISLSYEAGRACSNKKNQRWWLDSNGRIHNEARPDLCYIYTGNYGYYTLGSCYDADTDKLFFLQSNDGTIVLNKYRNQWMSYVSGVASPQSSPNWSVSSRIWSILPVSTWSSWKNIPEPMLKTLRELY